MFTSVLFNDINKEAFDVLKDGYSFDQKATLKYSIKGCNLSLEGKNFTSAIAGKLSVDCKPCKYLNIKKMSIENNGNAICDLDVPNLISGTTLMIRTQADAFTYDLKKAVCGMKYLSPSFAMDFSYDIMSQKMSTSGVFSKASVLAGVQLTRSKEGENKIDVAAAYKYKSIVLSLATCNSFKEVSSALYTKCRKNVELGATCSMPIASMEPQIAFGVRILPSSSSEFRTKVTADGKLAVFYKTSIRKNITVSATGSVDFNNMINGTHKIGIAMEARL